MLRRSFHCLLLVLLSAAAWIKGKAYIHDMRAGPAGSTESVLQLAYLLVVLALALVIVRNLLRGARTGSAAPEDVSFFETLRRVQAAARTAFAERPIWASLVLGALAIVAAGIPISLLAAGREGGMESFGPSEWVIVGLAELPVLFVVVVLATGFISDRKRNPRRSSGWTWVNFLWDVLFAVVLVTITSYVAIDTTDLLLRIGAVFMYGIAGIAAARAMWRFRYRYVLDSAYVVEPEGIRLIQPSHEKTTTWEQVSGAAYFPIIPAYRLSANDNIRPIVLFVEGSWHRTGVTNRRNELTAQYIRAGLGARLKKRWLPW